VERRLSIGFWVLLNISGVLCSLLSSSYFFIKYEERKREQESLSRAEV
jgi:hypothetical protein